jgi:hypothetical protein
MRRRGLLTVAAAASALLATGASGASPLQDGFQPDWLAGRAAPAGARPAPKGGLPHQTTEIRQERQVQKDLPQAGDPLWKVLRTTKVSGDAKTGLFIADHSAQVKALAGKTLTLSGFMLPLEQSDTTRHFLISRYTPVCFFCPPGDPNEVVEVRLRRPIQAGYSLVKVTGVFSLANNGEKGLFFRIDG